MRFKDYFHPPAIAAGFIAVLVGYSSSAVIVFQAASAAWSTPGAALLVTSLEGIGMAEALGAFLFSGLLITLSGISGWVEHAIDRIPCPSPRLFALAPRPTKIHKSAMSQD